MQLASFTGTIRANVRVKDYANVGRRGRLIQSGPVEKGVAVERKGFWTIITVIELAAIVATIVLDLSIPTLVLLALMAISLVIRRERISAMGFKQPKSWLGMAGLAFITAILMQLFDIGVVMPVMNRVTGETIDYSGFASLQGDMGQLLTILVFSWTLAAVGEELTYRGYVMRTLGRLLGEGKTGVVLAIFVSSLLFGLAHTEQGLVGVVVTTIDAVVFSWLKRRFDGNLWAPILAHGFYNSVGVITFYFTGPIYGLW